jgi:hypothetical protein
VQTINLYGAYRKNKLQSSRIVASGYCLNSSARITAGSRRGIPIPQALDMMAKTVGTALDGNCCAALKRAVERVPLPETA